MSLRAMLDWRARSSVTELRLPQGERGEAGEGGGGREGEEGEEGRCRAALRD